MITKKDTRTYEDFYKYLGVKPARLGVVSRMYDGLTATYLLNLLKIYSIRMLKAVVIDIKALMLFNLIGISKRIILNVLNLQPYLMVMVQAELKL